jgi:hypothetical protein
MAASCFSKEALKQRGAPKSGGVSAPHQGLGTRGGNLSGRSNRRGLFHRNAASEESKLIGVFMSYINLTF